MRASSVQARRRQARAGRTAWGVLGSAAGGHVVVLKNETRNRVESFGGKSKNCLADHCLADRKRLVPNKTCG
jgi:hypothetical protein